MSTYTLEEFQVPNGLDELGLKLGLPRLPLEDLAVYRRRLLQEIRRPSGPEERTLIETLNRRVGQFDVPVFEITPVLDANDDPLATDPFVEITSTHMRLYDDYSSGTPEIEINLVDTRFLRDVYTALAASTYFTTTILDSSYTFKRSLHLRYGNTKRYFDTQYPRPSRSSKLSKMWIQEIYPEVPHLFETEVGSLAAVDAVGKFFIDYTEGVVFTYEYNSGVISYSYRAFPYKVFWQPVRVFPYRDSDKVYKYYDTLIDDATGLAVNSQLNSHGAKIADMVLAVHPLGWGE